VGGGAVGVAGGRGLMDAHVDCLVVEARSRLGGRAWTMRGNSEFPIDLGCGWLHSADRNPWREIAEAQGGSIDKTPPPWTRHSAPAGFPFSEQTSFLQALQKFHQKLRSRPEQEPDVPAAMFLEPLGRGNALITPAVTSPAGAGSDRSSPRVA